MPSCSVQASNAVTPCTLAYAGTVIACNVCSEPAGSVSYTHLDVYKRQDNAAAYPWAAPSAAAGICYCWALHCTWRRFSAHGLHSRAVQARRALFHPSHAGAHAGFLPYLFANRPPSSPASRPAGHHKHAPISGRPRGVRRGSGHCLRLVFAPALYRRGGVSAGFRPRTVLDKAARTRRTVHKPSCVSSTLTGSVLSCPRNRLANAPCIRQGCGLSLIHI